MDGGGEGEVSANKGEERQQMGEGGDKWGQKTTTGDWEVSKVDNTQLHKGTYTHAYTHQYLHRFCNQAS